MSGFYQGRSSQSENIGKNGGSQNYGKESLAKSGDSSSDGDNSAVDNGEKLHYFHFEEVRFTPKRLEFIDAYPGKQFSKTFTLQNVGRNPVLVRIGEPTSFVFLLKKPIRRNIFLASGASITRVVTYTYHGDDLVQKSRIPIHINGKPIDFPIVVTQANAEIEVDPPQIDFGTINMGSEVKTLMLTIYNVGGARTKYDIDVGKNDLDLVVNPTRGTVKAKDHETVTVEIMGMKEGIFYKEIWIKSNGTPIRVPVLVEVVRPQLFIVYPNGTEELSAIEFPPTFVGTQRAVPFVLRNSSGETALFITVGEVNGEYQFLNEARKNHHIFNFFELTAEEGRMEPHENRVLTALFRPKHVKTKTGWHHQKNLENKWQTEHVVFFSLNRVHCIERKEIEDACVPDNHLNVSKSSLNLRVRKKSPKIIKMEDGSDAQTAVDDLNIKETGFRLCLRGISVKPEILLQPTELYIDELCLGQTEQKVLTVSNRSVIRVKCVVLKKMNVRVVPEQVWIGAGKVKEFSVRVTPTSAGEFHHKVKVQIWGESDVVYEADQPFKLIAEPTLAVSFKGVLPKNAIKPKIGPGITPLITDEVGLNKELVTFGNADKVPFAAKLLALSEEFRPPWMRMKTAEMTKTIMALPNDRPRGFQVWPKDQICRSIFKGWLRYAPPKDTLYTFPSREQMARAQQNDLWTNYLLMLREGREASAEGEPECREILPWNLRKFQEHAKFDQCHKLELMPEKIKRRFDSLRLKTCLVPLSPMYLSYVVVEPKMINFGLVGMNNSTSATLKINNHNVFPIAVVFMPGNSAVTVDKSTAVVHSASEKTITVRFRLNVLGRYYGFLNYVINGSHEFKVTISAFVIAMTVIVEPKRLVIGCGPQNKAFQPKSTFLNLENWVQSSIRYKLVFSPDAPYFAIPEEGDVPPKSKLLSEVITSCDPSKPFTSEITLISESGGKELLKVSQTFKKLSVRFQNNRINLNDIPLNLKTQATAVIENECFHDVTFEVTDRSPMLGVTVEPKRGVVKARSFFPIVITIQIPVMMEFSFDVRTIVQTSHQISANVYGKVVVPNIRIKPSTINMRKICSHSFDVVSVCVENAGTTPAEVDVDFKSCPECSVIGGNSHMYLNPRQAASVVIMFEPKDAARFVFYLPVIINNILGPPVKQEMETENVFFYISHLEQMYDAYGEVFDSTKSKETVPLATLSCTVASPLILVTPKSIVFDTARAIGSLGGENRNSVGTCNGHSYFQPKTLVISNESTDEVTFCIRNDDLGKRNDSPFELEPMDESKVEYRLRSIKVTLEPRESLTFTAKFAPRKPGKYFVKVPVYVRGYNNGVVYCYITLSGGVESPKLIPEAKEIHFYPVPLNVSSEITFTITARNYYRNEAVQCFVCEGKEEESLGVENLTMTWVETSEVTRLRSPQELSIRIAFCSAKPVALRCYLLFVDSSGNHCSVLLTAVADNSSLTLYTLLNFSPTKYKIVTDRCDPPRWKADEYPVLFYPFDKARLKSERPEGKSSYQEATLLFNRYSMAVTEGPTIVIQGGVLTNSAGLVFSKSKEEESGSNFEQMKFSTEVSSMASTIKLLEATKAEKKFDVTYPSYPTEDNLYKKVCDNTLQYAERWIYEVVMRCSQQYVIPTSFQMQRSHFDSEEVKARPRQQKNVIDFLSEIYEESAIPRLEVAKDACPKRWAGRFYSFYGKMLAMLESRGCFLPHVRAEHLLRYDDYVLNFRRVGHSEIIKPVSRESQINVSAKSSPKDLRQKVRSDEGQIGKASSNFSSKEWLSSKSIYDGYPMDDRNFDRDDVERVEAESHPRLVEGEAEVEGEFAHAFEVLDESEFEQRSKQAWLDVVIQIFRHSVLKKLVYKSTIPEVQVMEPGEKLAPEKMQTSHVSLYGGGQSPLEDLCTSNLYSVQERMLLLWLSHHLNVQREHLWRGSKSMGKSPRNVTVNNFHKDLSDSLALISVTASYCPYVVPEYFHDCFSEPNTTSKKCHNACRLVQAWRELNIGLTVETIDIVQPNNIFMLMLVAHLYEVLPELHPRHLICFEATLCSSQTKKFPVQTDLEGLIVEPKLLGEDSRYFTLDPNTQLELRRRNQDIRVTFSASKIKRMKATLLINGFIESPSFGKGLAFFLEGHVTDLTESQKLNFSAPLYKVICTEIPVTPPYPESTSYEVWYSTVKPALTECSDVGASCKPWSEISFRKVCRRLFLNRGEVYFNKEDKTIHLNVTVACFTRKDRFFWLLFRSEKRDFIVRIKIKTKTQRMPSTKVSCWYPDTWPTCTCPNTDKPRTNWADLSCPLTTVIKLPARNAEMWNALKTMFLKCVLPQEKVFWAQYFDKDIGLCIIRWLLNPDEEKEVIDEFLPLLQTNVTYDLTVYDSRKKLKMPPKIEVKDVREEGNFFIPVHITEGAMKQTVVDMVAESRMETRKLMVLVNPLKPAEKEEEEEKMVILSDRCKPCTGKPSNAPPLSTVKKSRKLAKLC